MTGHIIDLFSPNAPKVVYCAKCGNPIHGNPIEIGGEDRFPVYSKLVGGNGSGNHHRYYCMDCAIDAGHTSFADAWKTMAGWSQG